jgi:predicted O-methyltransferase YrrM
MSKITKGLAWLRDVVQVLVLDRLDPKRKRFSELASTSCRELRFHSRAKIRNLPLSQIIGMLTPRPVEGVLLPGPYTDLGDIGSQTGYHTLGALVRALQPKTILEFGTYLGVSAHTMALNALPDCRIYTVDLADDTSAELIPELNVIDQQHIRKSRHRVGEAFLRSSTQSQITQIRADSMTFRAETKMGDVDLVYIDGGHSLPVVTKDTKNAFRILSPTGTIVWDDYFHLYPDVVRFLDELRDQYPLHGIAGSNYVIYSRRFVGSHP